jgi:hypothetical protein
VEIAEDRVPALIRLRHGCVEREVLDHRVFLLRVDAVNPVERTVCHSVDVKARIGDLDLRRLRGIRRARVREGREQI